MHGTIETFSAGINRILGIYGKEVEDAVFEAIEEEAPKIVKNLKETSPKRPKGGKYAASWTKEIRKHRLYTNLTVYNKNHYQLTHLLENGHALWQGGRTNAHPHIKPAQDKAEKEIIKNIWEKLGL